MSASYISQLENKNITPSVDSLRKIARVLNIPVFHFLVEVEDQKELTRKNSRKTVELPKTELTYEIISSDPDNKFGIMKGVIKPGAYSAKTLQSHEGEECILVLEGKIRVELSSQNYLLEEQDSLHFDSSIPHRLINIGEEACHFYLVLSPPKF